jgi:2-oxoglutarate ferredoxin oxidoreductase subunit delta
MAKRGTIEIDEVKCKGCELCVVACPFNVIELAKEVNAKGYHFAVMMNEGCTGCANCSSVCPDAVITVYMLKN